MRALLILLALTSMLPAANAAQCQAQSGPRTAVLLELYTSEGCSSCPPADRWLSRFAGAKPDTRVVPIAFHVQYWDYIGWKDAFGDPRYTERQRAVARWARASGVYTPQVVVGGRDFPDWRNERAFEDSVGSVAAREPRASLSIEARTEPDGGVRGTLTATLRDGVRRDKLQMFVVARQDGLASRVTAGENRGERLAHDFVARDFAMAPLRDARSRMDFTFSPKAGWDAARISLAAFVQDAATGEVLQALSTGACHFP